MFPGPTINGIQRKLLGGSTYIQISCRNTLWSCRDWKRRDSRSFELVAEKAAFSGLWTNVTKRGFLGRWSPSPSFMKRPTTIAAEVPRGQGSLAPYSHFLVGVGENLLYPGKLIWPAPPSFGCPRSTTDGTEVGENQRGMSKACASKQFKKEGEWA